MHMWGSGSAAPLIINLGTNGGACLLSRFGRFTFGD